MNEFKRGLRYQGEGEGQEQSKKREGKHPNIKGYKTIRGEFWKKIVALVLAAGTFVGVAKGCEAKGENIDTWPEVTEHNLGASDLQITQELYNEVKELKSELEKAEQNNFEGITKTQLINDLSKLEDLYLKILKSKVSTITGLDTSEFTLIEPNPKGADTTLIKDPDRIKGIATMNSRVVDNYMRDIGTLRILSENVDMDESLLQKYVSEYAGRLDGLITLRMGIEEKGDGRKEIYTYYLNEKELTENSQARDDGDER